MHICCISKINKCLRAGECLSLHYDILNHLVKSYKMVRGGGRREEGAGSHKLDIDSCDSQWLINIAIYEIQNHPNREITAGL